jgi:hypothetical protein
MQHNFEAGQTINIPLVCENTKRFYGEFKVAKKKLLGNPAYIREVRGDKLIVSSSERTVERWFFHIQDFMVSEPVNIPVQTFDPQNLTV